MADDKAKKSSKYPEKGPEDGSEWEGGLAAEPSKIEEGYLPAGQVEDPKDKDK